MTGEVAAKFGALMEEALGKAANVPCDLDTYHEGLRAMADVLNRALIKAGASMADPRYISANPEGKDVYTLARQAFNEYAAMDAPDLPLNPQQALQVMLHRWLVRNIKDTVAVNITSAMGLGEELGEMALAVLKLAAAIGRIQHANLKASQGLRGFDDKDKLRREVLDAGCDVSIFLMQQFTTQRLDFWTAVHGTAEQVLKRDWKLRPLDAHTLDTP